MVEKITMNSECHIILNCNNVNGIHDTVLETYRIFFNTIQFKFSCTLEPAIQSGDNGKRIPFLTAVNLP